MPSLDQFTTVRAGKAAQRVIPFFFEKDTGNGQLIKSLFKLH
jgi:hypothetical protein